jgi:hypothetical protein
MRLLLIKVCPTALFQMTMLAQATTKAMLLLTVI